MTSIDLGIPGYTEVSELSRGGFATIYRAWQPTFEREVAIKVLSGKADDASTNRFRRECAAVGALSGHPNIVTVYEAGTTEDGRLFIVMELLHGGSLADQLSAQGTFDVADVLDYGGGSPEPSSPPTGRASSTATSSPRTSCSPASASPRSPISAWPSSPGPAPASPPA